MVQTPHNNNNNNNNNNNKINLWFIAPKGATQVNYTSATYWQMAVWLLILMRVYHGSRILEYEDNALITRVLRNGLNIAWRAAGRKDVWGAAWQQAMQALPQSVLSRQQRRRFSVRVVMATGVWCAYVSAR